MPVYEYTALDSRGKKTKGIIDADSPLTARNKLRGSDLFPVKIRESSSRVKSQPAGTTSIKTLLRRIKASEISTITRQLATLMSAGIPLVASLELLITQEVNPLLKKVLAQTKESVNEGNSLASSLANHSKYFSQIYINMVTAGEASGSLDLVLERLAEFSENQETLKGKVISAMVYPVIMLCIGVAALLLLVTFVVPKFVAVFDEMETALPLPTLIVIGVSNFLKSYWWLILLFFIVAGFIFRRAKRTERFARMWDEVKLKTPLFGSVIKRMIIARFARTLGSLLQSGVTLLNALEIVRNVVNNILVAEIIDNAIDEIKEGKALSAPLSNNILIPPVVVQMISVGEHSGELEKMLNKIADIYEREVESQVSAMTSMLEPFMLLGMAVIVGFIAISILLPIMEMSQIVH
ncbi:MAG: type II secretion system inner membrane protein GspF [Deltaproteobacteria bacterium]|nr:type II secretion system inner membrane protein GspF [Deltaproteobacteria bacterium]